MDPELPDSETKDIVGMAIHHAVSQFMMPSITHIAPINTIGAFFLQFTRAQTYHPVAGSITVLAGGTPFGRRAEPDKAEEHEYYLWIERNHPNGETEIIDFGAPYWKAWAEEQGAPWEGAEPPMAVWALKDDAAESLAVYEADPGLTDAVRKAIHDAVAERDSGDVASRWEDAVNDATEYMLNYEAGARYLIEAGIAEPYGEEE